MKNFFYCLFITIFLSALVSCGYYDDKTILLDSGWSYSVNTYTWTPISVTNFSKLSKLLPGRQGYIYLKNTFTVPDELKDRHLMCFMGNVKIASEFFINGTSVGTTGFFEPSPFSIGGRSTVYTLPPTLYDEDAVNEIIVKIFMDGEGEISVTPFISTQEKVTAKQEYFDFFNSKISKYRRRNRFVRNSKPCCVLYLRADFFCIPVDNCFQPLIHRNCQCKCKHY